MDKVIAFIRINKNNEEYSISQINSIKKYLVKNKIELSKSIKTEVNLPNQEENVMKLLEECADKCTVLVSDLNVFGRTIESIIEVVDYMLNRGARIISINQNFDLIRNDKLSKMILTVIGTTIDLEKNLMSLRTKEALMAKKLDGVHLGKPKGTIQKSKFDEQLGKIKELLSVGLSIRKIAKLLGYNNHIGLNNYIKKRNIRESLFDDNVKEMVAS